MDAPLLITSEIKAKFAKMREVAESLPIDIKELMETIKVPALRAQHMRKMRLQTVEIPGPYAFYVTYSVEDGHPVGRCRHLSMSIDREGRVPSTAAVWMVAGDFGFTGELCTCEAIWVEDLSDGGKAVNLVQKMDHGTEPNAA